MTPDYARCRSGMRSFMAALLDVELVRDEPDVAVVLVRGELDRTGVPRLAGCLREVLDRGGPGGSVVVNLTEVTFVDVGGVRLLTEVTGWAGDSRFAALPRRVQRRAGPTVAPGRRARRGGPDSYRADVERSSGSSRLWLHPWPARR